MSAIRNMNLSWPSRRAIVADSEMKMDLPRCFGCDSLAKTMPSEMASRIMPETFCRVRKNAEEPQMPTARSPKPIVACKAAALRLTPTAASAAGGESTGVGKHLRLEGEEVGGQEAALPKADDTLRARL